MFRKLWSAKGCEVLSSNFTLCFTILKLYLQVINFFYMNMDKNTVFAWASLSMFIIGFALVLLGILKYIDYAIGFSVIGLGFFTMSWTFHNLKGRI